MVVDIETRMSPASILQWHYRIIMYWWPVDSPTSKGEILWSRLSYG